MMYHSVDYIEKSLPNNINPSNFAWQMDFLKKHGYRVLSLDELVRAIESGRRLQRKSVVITFDDGYDNNYTYAFPILKSHGFPATIFCIAGTVGEKGYITWEQLREMERSGIAIGSHTANHVYLPGVPESDQRYQIWESKRILEERLEHPVDFFCYPSGGFNEKIKELVKQAGYRAAYTTNRGFDLSGRDIYELKRIRFGNKDSAMSMRFKLWGFNNFFKGPTEPN